MLRSVMTQFALALAAFASTTALAAGYQVGAVQRTFIDESRPIKASMGFAGSPTRRLDVHIWYPTATASGQPGQGKLMFLQPGDAQPFFSQAIPNPHSLTLHPNGKRLVVAATNANSAGNGRNLGKNKEYPGNFSPLHIFDLPG